MITPNNMKKVPNEVKPTWALYHVYVQFSIHLSTYETEEHGDKEVKRTPISKNSGSFPKLKRRRLISYQYIYTKHILKRKKKIRNSLCASVNHILFLLFMYSAVKGSNNFFKYLVPFEFTRLRSTQFSSWSLMICSYMFTHLILSSKQVWEVHTQGALVHLQYKLRWSD